MLLHAIGKMKITGGAPSPYLVPRTIQHAFRTRAQGTLLVPQWSSAAFWPMLFPDGEINAWFIWEV